MTTYICTGIAWAIGLWIGLYISAHRNPLTLDAIMEDNRKRRIVAEQEFRHLVKIRMGKQQPDGRYEEWILETTPRKFAQRCEQMFQSYGQDLRGSEVYVQIMSNAVPFEYKDTLAGEGKFQEIKYH